MLEGQALNDRPGPVLIECVVDGEPRGILSFDKKDMTWERKGFALPLAAGRRRVDDRRVISGIIHVLKLACPHEQYHFLS